MRITDLISIIVPVYNAENVLQRCVNSLVSQTYTPVEIILVDDGSADSSLSICEELAKNHSNIKVISQENSGAASARNAGLSEANGEYIMFVDSDDLVDKRICEKLIGSIKKNGAQCAICGHDNIREDGSLISVKNAQEDHTLTGRESLYGMYCGHGANRLNLVGVCWRLFHYSMWTDVWFEDGLYYEDLEIIPRLFYEWDKINEISYVGYHYYIYNDSASHSKGTDDKRVWDSIYIREKHIKFFDEKNEKDIAEAIIQILLDLIVTSGKNGWIPKDRIQSVADLYQKYWKRYKHNKDLPMRQKIKYELFYLGGKQSFHTYHQ